TDDIVATTGDLNVAKDAMELIRAVPNPYYGNSSYEINQLDNRVKITNLPQRATISIFTVSGTLVRNINKDDSVTSVDWDLKNDYGIPIASGLYIIHVNAPGIGEKIIKWFGALRPIDMDTF
ncbi:MAG: T9SS type A sorting domain-containing protein, partial [Flavobacteriales bacterium]|nr:T9SS type A sorting domain-containing protein [Flavobacteriales bacterium]